MSNNLPTPIEYLKELDLIVCITPQELGIHKYGNLLNLYQIYRSNPILQNKRNTK
jgi:hypothetical protein